MKTEKYILTIGINAGYKDDYKTQNNINIKDFTKIAMRLAEEVYAEDLIYPSFVCNKARVGYREEWGCPEDGELVFVLTGVRNPKFIKSEKDFDVAWAHFALKLKKYFRQKTCTLEKQVLNFEYLQN
jgi:hypothetical protein